MKTKLDIDETFEYPDNPEFTRKFYTGCLAVMVLGAAIASLIMYGLVSFLIWCREVGF